MLEWTEIKSLKGRKITATLSNGEQATIAHSSKYNEPGMIAVLIYGKDKIYPHTIKNFETESDCLSYVEQINNS